MSTNNKDCNLLTRRSDGRWCKKYRGKMFYFRGTEVEATSQWELKLAELTTIEAQQVTMRRLSDIQPSPENLDIYQPVTPESVVGLVAEVKRDGILEPIVITQDDYILSGHRRHKAATIAGLEEVPVRVHPIRREDDTDEFVRLLIAHNTQRVKSFAEKLHEEAAKIDPAEAYRRLKSARIERSTVSLKAMDLKERRARSKISSLKQPMLDACLAILHRLSKPVSDRKIHYELLNSPPLKNANKKSSQYRNDANSYHNLTNLLTRARIEGLIPWDWISDETRPVTTWNVWPDTQKFIATQMKSFLTGYWRDLMQSQPNHIEILAEKNTVSAAIKNVAARYCIPLTSGRGFCSSLPRHKMAQRYRNSGKSKLVLLIVSDLDPAGMAIAESFAQSLRDDFGIEDVHAIKVAITFEQVKKFKLPHGEKAKQGRGKNDGLRAEFVRRYGEYVYEVEALPDGELPTLLDAAIRKVVNIEAHNYEVEQEKKDSVNIEATREAARSMFKELDVESGEDDSHDEEDEEDDE
jgi:hypothetical protein